MNRRVAQNGSEAAGLPGPEAGRGAGHSPLDCCIYSPASRGGAGLFLFSLCEAMAEAGATIRLIAPAAVPAELEPAHPAVKRSILIAGKAGQASLAERVARTVWRIASTFPALLRGRLGSREIMITLFDWIPVLVAQMLWVKAIGGRLTFLVHDATPHAWAFPSRWRGIERALYRLSYRLPDRVISLTEAVHRELAETWGRTERSWIIPHGAPVDAPLAPLPGDHIVLVFGMLRRNKRILESIEAMRLVAADLPQLRMVIAGAPHAEDAGYWTECEAALAGLEGVVRTEIGFVAEERVRELLAGADAVLLAYEQFNSQSGVAVMAAFAERVVIATNAGGIAELGGLGLELVPVERPVTPAHIAEALRRFAATPVEERRRMARDGRSRLADRLAWPRIGRDYVALLSQT